MAEKTSPGPGGGITPLQQMLASGTGAILTSLFVTPLDVVKIRLQAQRTPFSKGTPLGLPPVGMSPLVPGCTGPWRGRCCRGPPPRPPSPHYGPVLELGQRCGAGWGARRAPEAPHPLDLLPLVLLPELRGCSVLPAPSGCQKGADPSTPWRTPGTASGLPAAPVWCQQGSVPSPFLLGAGGWHVPGALLSLSPLCFSVVGALGALGLSAGHV